MNPESPAYLRLIRRALDSGEPSVAAAVLRAVNTPEVAGSLLELGRWVRVGTRGIDKLRSDAVHLLSIPSYADVRAIAHELAAMRSSLAEVESRLGELDR